MPEPKNSTPLEDTVVIVGVGLIGGSLAAALKHRQIARRVIGIGRVRARIDAARNAGLIDEADTDLDSHVAGADVIVFCTPVGQVVSDVRRACAALAACGKLPSDHLWTDVGSVKASICAGLADVDCFLGSHPIAGSHRHGYEAADPKLFDGRVCVLTPHDRATAAQVERLERFWQAVGMQTVRMSPDAHDAALAMTSHLPHVVAAGLANTLSDQNRPLIGSGFRDTTRIAAGSPDIWTEILLSNSGQITASLDLMQGELSRFREAIANQDRIAIRELLASSQQIRASLDQSSSILPTPGARGVSAP